MDMTDAVSYAGALEMIGRTCGAVYPRSAAEGIQYGEAFGSGGGFLVWHYCGFAHIFGEYDEGFLEQVYSGFLSPGISLPRRFVLFTDDKDTERFFREKEGLAFGKRYFFEYQQERAAELPQLPRGCSLRELDGELLNSLSGRITPRFSWRDDRSFLDRGKGFCVMYHDEPAAWAFSAAVSADETDIGVETSPEFRRKGLAAAAVARMTEYCLAQNKRPVWACDASNAASRRLAEKLGFGIVSECTTVRREAADTAGGSRV